MTQSYGLPPSNPLREQVAQYHSLTFLDASPMTEADLPPPARQRPSHRTIATCWSHCRGGSRHAVTGGGGLCQLSDMRDKRRNMLPHLMFLAHGVPTNKCNSHSSGTVLRSTYRSVTIGRYRYISVSTFGCSDPKVAGSGRNAAIDAKVQSGFRGAAFCRAAWYARCERYSRAIDHCQAQVGQPGGPRWGSPDPDAAGYPFAPALAARQVEPPAMDGPLAPGFVAS